VPRVQRVHFDPGRSSGLALDTLDKTGRDGGPIVRTQGAGAIWRVSSSVTTDDGLTLMLEPVDPHDVPVGVHVLELPRGQAVV